MLIEGADRIAIGREFQSSGPIIEKALSPNALFKAFALNKKNVTFGHVSKGNLLINWQGCHLKNPGLTFI